MLQGSQHLQQQIEDTKRAFPLFGCRMLRLMVDEFEGAREGQA
jgi:hypothetical protein